MQGIAVAFERDAIEIKSFRGRLVNQSPLPRSHGGGQRMPGRFSAGGERERESIPLAKRSGPDNKLKRAYVAAEPVLIAALAVSLP